jgi:hypothetical protein
VRCSTPISARPVYSHPYRGFFTDRPWAWCTRWSYLNRDYNFLTEVEAMLLTAILF